MTENKKYNAIAFRCWIEEKGYKKSTTGWFETIYADAPGPYTSRKISHVAKTDSELYDIFATSQQEPESVCPICDGRGRVSYYTGEDGGKEKGEQVEGKIETPSHTDDIIFPFSGYALREGYFGGKYHGYPECCILWYLGETEIHKKSKEDLQGIDVLKNGFLPCPQHQDMIRGGEIRIEDLIQNRICPEPFSELPELNAGQYPLIGSNQTDIKRIGLKAFDDSMKNTLGELIEAEENPFAESEADQQVPEGPSLINLSEIPMTDKVDFVDGLVNICCHNLMKAYLMLGLKWGLQTKVINEATSEHFVFQFLKVDPASQTPLLSDMLEAEKAANATLKESFKSSVYQYDQDMEIVKGERDELCDLLNILNEGYSDHFTKFLNDRIYKALNKFTNNKDNA